MPPWLPKINYAYHVNKHTVYFHLFVKSKAWFKLGGSFLPFVIQWLPVMVLSSLVASLLLVTVCHKAVVLLFHLTSFILRNNTHFKKYIKHTHTYMHSVNNTCKVIVSRNWNTAGIPEIIYVFLPNHRFFPSFIIVTFIVLCFSLQPVYIFFKSIDSFYVFLLYVNRVIIFILLWLLLFNVMCEAYPWQLCVAFAHSLSLLFCVFFL